MSGIGALLMASASAPLAVSASPPALLSGGTTNTFQTAETSVIVTGGVGPYTYSWATDNPDVLPVNSTLAKTAFNISGIAIGEVVAASATCTVRDATNTAATVSVAINHQDQRF